MSDPQSAWSEAEDAADDSLNVNLHWAVKIPWRDGTQLDATLYTPKQQSAPVPCDVTLTPHVADSYHDRGVYFAPNGIAAVDARGRGNSEGTFRPFTQEANGGSWRMSRETTEGTSRCVFIAIIVIQARFMSQSDSPIQWNNRRYYETSFHPPFENACPDRALAIHEAFSDYRPHLGGS